MGTQPMDGRTLEAAISEVEQRIAALGEALHARDTQAIETHANELQRALSRAVERVTVAAKAGTLPPALRQRLAVASGHVAAQRESLARATAALDRAMDVLMPSERSPLYGLSGSAERARSAAVLKA